MAGDALLGLEDEVKRQPWILGEFVKSKLPRAPKGSIFVGAGDSYAAALAGFYASGGRCIALDPYSLASAPEIARGLEVFFISVSGRTASNLMAARKVGQLATRTTALTAVDDSQLARLADRVVRLPMDYAPRTAGMLAFSLSLLAVLQMAGGMIRCDFRGAFRKAVKDSGTVSYGRGTTYFLGNSLAYPAALYAAAKTYEILGTKAHAELLEEFSHLELFSLGKADVVNAFSSFDQSDVSGRLTSALIGQRYEAHSVPGWGTSDVERLIHSVFAVQLSVLGKARRAGLSEPKFLAAGGRLRASDTMIY